MKKLFILIALIGALDFCQASSFADEKVELNGEELLEKDFYISEIDDSIFARIKGKSFKDNCTVPKEDLRYLHLLHKDMTGKTTEGELICNKKIADKLLFIFKELYKADYPIEKMHLIDEYNADDEQSMQDNNSSCFNFRFISFTTKVSKHGYGLAIDINPLYNPYVKKVAGKTNVEPAAGMPYVDRSKSFPCKIDHDDLAYKLFTAQGFEWGGDWSDRKDFQHFEAPDSWVK